VAITLVNSSMVYPGGGGTPFGTFNIDCGTDPDRLILLYALTYQGSYGDPTNVQLDGSVNFTSLFAQDWDLWSNYFRIRAYYLINPSTGAHSITGTTYASAWNTYLLAMAFSGALQSAPTNYNGAGGQLNESLASVTITPADAASLLAECVVNWNDTACTNVANNGQTKIQEQQFGGTAVAAGGYSAAGGTGSQTRGWTFTPDSTVNLWNQAIVELQPAPTVPTFNALALGLNT
jgi:hypothetical protein